MDNKVPEEYFNQFPERLMDKLIHLEDDLEKDAKNLLALGKEEPYRIPDNYFTKSKARIFQKTIQKSKYLVIKNFLAIAACMLLLITLFNNYSNKPIQKESKEFVLNEETNQIIDEDFTIDVKMALEGISDEEVDEYLSEIMLELSDEELLELL